MLGQPVSMLIPRVVGFKLTGELPEGATATDLVLTITEMLRKHGVVGKFVEFYGAGRRRGAAGQPRHHRQHEPGVRLDRRDLPDRRRDPRLPAAHRPHRRAGRAGRGLRQGAGPLARRRPRAALLRVPRAGPVDRRPVASPGPKRPQDRVVADRRQGRRSARRCATTSSDDRTTPRTADSTRRSTSPSRPPTRRRRARRRRRRRAATTAGQPARTAGERPPEQRRPRSTLADGTSSSSTTAQSSIAAITSCTNTSNPSVMIGAALLAKKAVERGLTAQAVGQDHAGPRVQGRHGLLRAGRPDAVPRQARLQPRRLRLHDLHRQLRPAARRGVSAAVNEADLAVVSVLSGNRNFEGRINPDVKMNYLASPPLVVAYALAGTMDIDLPPSRSAPDTDGNAVFLRDIWPTAAGDRARSSTAVDQRGDVRRRLRRRLRRRRALAVAADARRATPSTWDAESTYVRKPPYFDGMPAEPAPVTDIAGARVLAQLGDSVTTDHISPGRLDQGRHARPARTCRARRRAPRLQLLRLPPRQPRGDDPRHVRQHPAAQPARARHRGRRHPQLHLPAASRRSIYDASRAYQAAGIPLVVLAGKEYGSGSSRDWAAKGTALLGVKAVIAESLRAHPPLEPDRHGRAAAAVPRGPDASRSA